jgi:pyrroloquinoline-quinone synthase
VSTSNVKDDSNIAPRISALAESIVARVGLRENPYFTALRDGRMALEQFRASQAQFYFAVRYFARPMAALIARMPDPASRLDVLHNVVEEHGDFQPARFHANTFKAFLRSIDGEADVDGLVPGPAVHAFNNTIMAACTVDDIDTGVCCLGVIEHAFAGISARIGQAVVARGWVGERDLVHYALHAELDVRHAAEFFKLVEGGFDDPRRRASIDAGLELGAYAFDQLYRNL